MTKENIIKLVDEFCLCKLEDTTVDTLKGLLVRAIVSESDTIIKEMQSKVKEQ